VVSVQRIAISPGVPDAAALERAAVIIRSGGVVAFPTDTFYGLAADPRNAAGVARIFLVKGRDERQPLPLVAADQAQVAAAARRLSPLALRLGARFWPGPLTLVVEASPDILPTVHAGTGTVAIRVPGHLVARELASRSGFAIVSTSANRTGEPAVSTAAGVVASIGSLVDAVLDAGTTPGGAASTIVDARGQAPRLLREGAIAFSLVMEAS
jgi:L-threonylcarbamoyladenylate synthase